MSAKKRATKEMLCLTSFQLKMNLFSCLTKVSPRTICHILLDGLGDALQGSTEETLLGLYTRIGFVCGVFRFRCSRTESLFKNGARRS